MTSKKRRKFITEETIIKFDEEAFKVIAQKLYWELLVEFINNKYGRTVVELKVTND